MATKIKILLLAFLLCPVLAFAEVQCLIGDGDGTNNNAHVHRRGIHAGVITFQDKLFQAFTDIDPLLNPTFGADMNQNISFGSIASIMHDGGSSSSAKTGTADGDTLNELVDSGGGFNAAVVVGMSVHNTTDDTYANVTAVTADTRLTFATDLFPDGNETYIINAVYF